MNNKKKTHRNRINAILRYIKSFNLSYFKVTEEEVEDGFVYTIRYIPHKKVEEIEMERTLVYSWDKYREEPTVLFYLRDSEGNKVFQKEFTEEPVTVFKIKKLEESLRYILDSSNKTEGELLTAEEAEKHLLKNKKLTYVNAGCLEKQRRRFYYRFSEPPNNELRIILNGYLITVQIWGGTFVAFSWEEASISREYLDAVVKFFTE